MNRSTLFPYLVTGGILFAFSGNAQSILVNPDGTHSVIIRHNDMHSVQVNPDGTHTLLVRHNDMHTIQVNPDGTHTVRVNHGDSQVWVNPDGTHSILLNSNSATPVLVNPEGSHTQIIKEEGGNIQIQNSKSIDKKSIAAGKNIKDKSRIKKETRKHKPKQEHIKN